MLSDLLPFIPLPAAQAMRRALTAAQRAQRRRLACAAAEILLKLAAAVRIAARAAAQLALQIAETHGYGGIARRARAILKRLEP